ncbi:MAG: hypothetical protein RIA63_01100 [Cyclobacteriaceae bacterium]
MRSIATILFFAACINAFGQLNNKVFEDRLEITSTDSGKLYLGLNFLGFSKNNEYFNTIIEGYTLLGYQLNPYLSYQLRDNVRLDAGVYVQQDFGNRDFSSVSPTLSLKITKGPFALLFGNLESSLNHRLIEPLYDFERVLNNRLETGIQLMVMYDDLFLDVWLDWQSMIYNNDPEQEKFVSGVSLRKRVVNSGIKLFVPVQLQVSHRGGQINTNPPPLETVFNSAIGLEAQREYSGWIKSWTLNGFHVYYDNLGSTIERPYKDGSGFYANANVSTSFGLDMMASYWQGHEFLSIQGGKIYPSVSEFDYRVQREEMQLLIFRFLYNREIAKGLTATLRFEPYYDLGFESFQYSYGFYLQFRDRFLITKRK